MNLKTLLIALYIFLVACKKESEEDPIIPATMSISGINPTSGARNTVVTITGNAL